MFGHLELFTMRAYFRAREVGILPAYLGSTIRGVLGHCMREFACIYPNEKCHLCSHAPGCDYAQHFCSPGHEAGSVNPYVIYTPIRGKTQWDAGDMLFFDLTLVGKSAHSAGVFLDGLQAMSERGWGARQMRFELEQVIIPQSEQIVWSGGKSWLRNVRPHGLESSGRKAKSVLIRFDSPTRVVVSQQVCNALTFSQIMISASRRIALLSHAYAGVRMSWDEEALLQEAGRIRTVEERWFPIDFSRYSINRAKNLELPAIEGWARFEGNLEPLTAILEAGQRLHIGKNATHGFGHYELFYDR
ncbi:CRISPR system precrRNA processing endoribonuclease RAMP protein Cas6 [Paenibacillus sp. GCM10027627]|uniref:CRISPR system precrRNA processing endoribonuclease RAMP protein Cas6 n=1 Tax=unclassified Paenibacillus TaxID=185978 RepID=UPI00362F1544